MAGLKKEKMSAREKEKTHRPIKAKGKAASGAQKNAPKKISARKLPVIKYDDIGRPLESGQMVRWWEHHDTVKIFPLFREASYPVPKSYHFWDHRYLMKTYGLRGWEFGNWLSQEDRLNYVCAVGLSLFDLRKVLGFKAADIGLSNMITMAIGARGKSKALAHFEPHSFAINLTRYKRGAIGPSRKYAFLKRKPKLQRFVSTGGVGSLAHEYGHALDYFFGGYIDQSKTSFALSGGHSVRNRSDKALLKKKSLRGQMERIIHAIIWQKPNQQTDYYKRLMDFLKRNKIKSDYYYRRNELFARLFEQYISFKLAQKGSHNAFLSKKKYSALIYLPPDHLKKVVPKVDSLIRMMRKALKA